MDYALNDIVGLLNKGFYNIENKKPLLIEYERLFDIKLCDTCTSSYIQAFQALRKYYKDMETSKYKLNPEYAGQDTHCKGISTVVNEENLTDKLAEELIAKGYDYLVSKAEPKVKK